MVLLLSLGLWFANEGGMVRPELKAESYVYHYLLPVGPWALEMMGNVSCACIKTQKLVNSTINK